MIFGTIQNNLEAMRLRQRWQMRQDGLLTPEDGRDGFASAVPVPSAGDAAKKAKLAAITSKLKAGKKLTAVELQFLRENDPPLYRKARRIMLEREEYGRSLRACRSREEARRRHTQKLQQCGVEAVGAVKDLAEAGARMESVEYGQMRQAAVQDEYNAFGHGSRLPSERDRKKKDRLTGRSV